MKTTGIVRRLDNLGRVVLPMELRRTLGINEGDPMEVFVDGDRIVLKKYTPGCYLCGDIEEDTKPFYGNNICLKCIGELSKQAGKIKESLSPAIK